VRDRAAGIAADILTALIGGAAGVGISSAKADVPVSNEKARMPITFRIDVPCPPKHI